MLIFGSGVILKTNIILKKFGSEVHLKLLKIEKFNKNSFFYAMQIIIIKTEQKGTTVLTVHLKKKMYQTLT